ncbi:hypothetical protein DS2_03250 [Catenovulum agarivorans DS-2]|uniref:Transposase n=1 Tax=Catenovulum agarivorans DS-2 TaxID=1328313 RepID=W7QR67_9ALTE|nr:transposase [Catenovulum agarivorans]EWH11492.1 hypothetical protein DS2_03250 [Catenovulum agarivorans DS-2]
MPSKETLSFKLKCIEAVVHQQQSLCSVAEQHHVGKRKLLKWITQYHRGELYRPHVEELNQIQSSVIDLERQLQDLQALTKMLSMYTKQN